MRYGGPALRTFRDGDRGSHFALATIRLSTLGYWLLGIPDSRCDGNNVSYRWKEIANTERLLSILGARLARLRRKDRSLPRIARSEFLHSPPGSTCGALNSLCCFRLRYRASHCERLRLILIGAAYEGGDTQLPCRSAGANSRAHRPSKPKSKLRELHLPRLIAKRAYETRWRRRAHCGKRPPRGGHVHTGRNPTTGPRSSILRRVLRSLDAGVAIGRMQASAESLLRGLLLLSIQGHGFG